MKKFSGVMICASVLMCAPGAFAADMSYVKKAPIETPEEPEDMSRFEINTSLDVTSRRSVFGYGSITFSPFGILDQSGFRLKLEGINGGYHYNTQGDPNFFQPPLLSIHGHFVGASALVGYEWVNDWLNVAAYVGADYQHDSETWNPADAFNAFGFGGFGPGGGFGFGFGAGGFGIQNPTIGTHWGVKFATDIDYHPTDYWSFALSGNYSTSNNSWWSRFRPGYAVWEDVYVGPEFGYQGNNFYQQWRIGAHLRGAKLGPVEIGLATGFARDSVVGDGIYGNVEASIRF